MQTELKQSRMREGFEAQRKAGMNVDWFTWQIAWHDALFTERDIAGECATPPTEEPCDTCHGRGQICVGTSGREDDGNAPEFERCPECGYGDVPAASAEFEWPPLPAFPEVIETLHGDSVFTEHQMQGYANAYGEAVRAALAARSSSPVDDPKFIPQWTRKRSERADWCDTMERPKSQCGCPDCGSSLVDLGPGLRNTPSSTVETINGVRVASDADKAVYKAIANNYSESSPVEAGAGDQIEHLDTQNHVYRRTMQKIMARLAYLLDEDQFAEIEGLVKSAGVEPPAQAGEPKLTDGAWLEQQLRELYRLTANRTCGWMTFVKIGVALLAASDKEGQS